MSLEPVLQFQFNRTTSACLASGPRGALVEGCSYGVALALAKALPFHAGAILVVHGTYTYLQTTQVLNFVVFTVTTSSQLMASSFSIPSFFHFLDFLLLNAQSCSS
jgi:ATP-binding cassette subfamily B (MDR/TAP) protein 1